MAESGAGAMATAPPLPAEPVAAAERGEFTAPESGTASAVVPLSATPPSLAKSPPAPPPTLRARGRAAALAYFTRWRGIPGRKPLPLASFRGALKAGLCGAAGMMALAGVFRGGSADATDAAAVLIGSFGASAVLVYSAPGAPLSQPRNVFFGHVVSAAIGVAARVLLVDMAGAGDATARLLVGTGVVGLSIFAMALFGVTHPPGGATALLAVLGNAHVVSLGWL
jgi:CBS-domain-containing membrane protein